MGWLFFGANRPWKKTCAFAQRNPVSHLEPNTPPFFICREPLTQLAAVPLPVPVPPLKVPQIDVHHDTLIHHESIS